jgi:hypothetical protein
LACSSVCRLSFGSDIHSRIIFRRVSCSGFMFKIPWSQAWSSISETPLKQGTGARRTDLTSSSPARRRSRGHGRASSPGRSRPWQPVPAGARSLTELTDEIHHPEFPAGIVAGNSQLSNADLPACKRSHADHAYPCG